MCRKIMLGLAGIGMLVLMGQQTFAGEAYNDKMLLIPDGAKLNDYNDAAPGSSKRLPRGTVAAPPQIPHNIDGIEISREMNGCMACHAGGSPDFPQVPASHYTELATGLKTTDLNMKRYYCTFCHVAQTTDELPVASTFKGVEGSVDPGQRLTIVDAAEGAAKPAH